MSSKQSISQLNDLDDLLGSINMSFDNIRRRSCFECHTEISSELLNVNEKVYYSNSPDFSQRLLPMSEMQNKDQNFASIL